MKSTLIAAAAFFLSLPRPASAEVGVVVVTGTLKQRQVEIVESAANDVLRAASWNFVDPALTADERAAVSTCMGLTRPWSCVAESVTDKKLDRVVLIDIRPDKTTREEKLALTVQIAAAGTGVATTEGMHCDKPCSDDRLRATATEVVATTAKNAATRNASVELEIRSSPPGASIKLDGEYVGTTNRTVKLTSGSHSVLLQLDGYQPGTQTVTISNEAGAKAEPIDVTLVPNHAPPHGEGDGDGPKPEQPPTRSHHSRVLPSITIGVGLAAFVGGWAYSRTREPPTTYEQPEQLNSKAGIAVSLTGGAVAIAGAIWLWAWWPRDDKPAPTPKVSTTPTVTINASELTFGWVTTF